MTSKRQSSSSQSKPQYGDRKWDWPDISAVDGCGSSLSTLSLTPFQTAESESSTYEPRTDYSYLGTSDDSGMPPGHLPGAPEYPDQYQYQYSYYQISGRWVSPPYQYQTVNESSMDPGGAELIGSTLVSPSSTPPSRRSTMDDVPNMAQHQIGVSKTPERRSSGDVPKPNKKPRSHRHQSRASRSDKGNNHAMAKDNTNHYLYPPVLDDADLYDPPASSSNGSWPQNNGYEVESGWDMCE